jgi:hypothetical protein
LGNCASARSSVQRNRTLSRVVVPTVFPRRQMA